MRLRKTCPAAVFAAVVLMAGTTACGDSGRKADANAEVTAPKNLVTSGTLTYGTAATFPPFESKAPGGDLEGFDIEMVNALSKSMGLHPKAMDMDFDGLVPALAGRRIDIINSAMYITPEREAKVDFVPYLVIGEALLTPSGNPKNIQRVPEDLAGKTVAVTRGAIGETYMKEFNEELKKQGLSTMKIMTLPNNQDAMLAVRSGRADAFDTSTPGAATTMQKTKDFTIAATFKNETKIGIAVRKGDSATATAVREALRLFEESGGYAALMAKYKLPQESRLLGADETGEPPSPGASKGS
ncbi:ABC transporter substrate-binding protein [Wenjunlia vitaminophila]|uniref:ABC transporter substrate-binding protein n=1 Tax=Wenjunlia vitaminophila TaxID=76728 RepID=A0A0T6LVH5_WENVI|nr:ABC transporter substrate-binding protein [Wenjunlia vitaminophila]KRV49842.1 ABC transporter substrate-binding protein [Wenjunlia vitaminophila]